VSPLLRILRLPPALLQPFCNVALEAVRRAHPLMFRRMGRLEGAWFHIIPADAPVSFFLHASGFSPRLVAMGHAGKHPAKPAATITAPPENLIALMDGSRDGDAMFFGRGLRIEGNMEAVLALRNAIEGAAISPLDDLAALLGPLAILIPKPRHAEKA